MLNIAGGWTGTPLPAAAITNAVARRARGEDDDATRIRGRGLGVHARRDLVRARRYPLHDLVLGSSRDVRPGGGDKIEPSAARRGDPGSVGLRRRRGFARFAPPERSRRRAHVHLERCPPGDAQAPRPSGAPAHSADFLAWATRHGKLSEYCPGSAPPCEESLHRETVWRENARHIEAHNRASGSLMRKGLTRFADLTVEEFTNHHATYSSPMVQEDPSRERARRGLAPTVADLAAASEHRTPNTEHRTRDDHHHHRDAIESSSERESESSSAERGRRARAPVSLKEATNVAARGGESLPSDAIAGSILGRVFPALGASGGLTRDERERRARERRANRRRRRREVERDIADGLNLGGPLGTGFPKRHDWAEVYDFGDVVHQGTCAGCWAYSTAAVVEAANAIANGAHRRLSPYALIDCDNLDHGCATGNMASAYAWIQTSRHGIPPLERYPSRAAMGCDRASLGKAPGRNVRTEGYCDLPVLSRNSERQLLEALWQQPVAVGVNIHALQFYESGIVRREECPPADKNPLKAINHAAVLTGWGHDEETGTYYWILRNTYGDHWGEKGYARLAFGKDEDGFGACALYTEGNYPIVGNLTCTPGAVRKEAVRHGNARGCTRGVQHGTPRRRGLNLRGALGLLGDGGESAALAVAGALVAASTVVMAYQAVALARLRGMESEGAATEKRRMRDNRAESETLLGGAAGDPDDAESGRYGAR